MARKSLAEQLADINKPNNDFDIEDNDLADPFAAEESEASDASDDEALQREHYVSVPKSKLRGEQKLVNGKKYVGEVADRKSLYDDAHHRPNEGSEDEGSEDEGDDIEDAGDSDNQMDDDEGSDSGASLRSNSDEDSESEPESQEEEEADETDEETADMKRERIKSMMAKERKHIVGRLSESASADALKGYAVLQQHKEFDALIDCRLKVQKALTSSNLLPVSKSSLEKGDLSTKHTSKYIKKASEKCYDLLDTIFKLRNDLYTRDKIVTEPLSASPKKRTLAEYQNTTSKYDDVLNQYRPSVLTKWSAKIQNSSGSSAMNASKFKVLNQSAEQQVVNNLSDMDRLVKRTKLNRRNIKPLGYQEPVEEKEDTNGQNDDVPDAKFQGRSLNMQEMDSIFDDEDFYRVLLNDLVDKKIQSSDPTSGLQFALRGAASTKLKKNVDSKASKGRKLRYHVQEQIANFDTPRAWLKWNDGQIDEFFASLLGQKISMKENSSDEEEEEEEEEIVDGDSIKLFG